MVLRETLQLPECEFSSVKTKLMGIKALMLNHEIKSCIVALREVYVEWEQAIEEKQVLLMIEGLRYRLKYECPWVLRYGRPLNLPNDHQSINMSHCVGSDIV